jgi:hypothetical protein
VSYVVIDTDIASGVLGERLPSSLEAQLVSRTMTITFVTFGELTKWTLIRDWDHEGDTARWVGMSERPRLASCS